MPWKERTAALFNEWMRRYIEEPEKFRSEFESAERFLAEQSNGEVPSYGANCVQYLTALAAELFPEAA